MNFFINKFILFIHCILIFYIQDKISIFSTACIAILLINIALSSFSYFLTNKYFTIIEIITYGIFAILIPEFCIMFPLVMYDVAYFSYYHVAIVYITITCIHFITTEPATCLLIIIGIGFACYIQYTYSGYSSLLTQSHKIRDDGTETNMFLIARNQSILDKQDYEIYNATLKERNRIAREIHDNVGHMLSRAILLTGVLKTINKDCTCTEHINNLHDCLNQAMDNIRESVHNLHDDSINLKNAINTIVNNFSFCKLSLVYDMGFDIPNDVKFSFISIIKEALNNIYKHSNATNVEITLREHPAMYQLIISDNGTNTPIKNTGNGIGIENMMSRVNNLNGTMKIHTEKGFCIFITIPKQYDIRTKNKI